MPWLGHPDNILASVIEPKSYKIFILIEFPFYAEALRVRRSWLVALLE